MKGKLFVLPERSGDPPRGIYIVFTVIAQVNLLPVVMINLMRKDFLERQLTFKAGLGVLVLLLGIAGTPSLHADTVTVSGTINQSTQDGTGPAVNNPGLNDIQDGASYTVSLSFTGSVNSPGTFNFSGSNLRFAVADAGAVENSFDSISLTVTKSGPFAQFSLLGCVATGSGCNQGNELDLSFMIPSVEVHAQNISAQPIPGLLPLDLLEDDGATDIHGLITNYSYTPANPVPEPSALVLIGASLIVVGLKQRRGNRLR